MDLEKNLLTSSSIDDEDDVFYSDADTEQSDDIEDKRVRLDDYKEKTLLYDPKSYVCSNYDVKKDVYKVTNHKHPNSINSVSRSSSSDIDVKEYLPKNKTSSFKRRLSSSIRHIRSRTNSEVLVRPRIEYDSNSLNSHYRKIEELSNKFGTVDLNSHRKRRKSSSFKRGFTSSISSSSSGSGGGGNSFSSSGGGFTRDRFSFVRRSFNRLHTFEHIINRQENASCMSRLKSNPVSIFHEVPMITLVSYTKSRI